MSGRDRKALTILQYVQLSLTLVDSRFVAATPRAAEIYGYAKPEELIDRYLSQTMQDEDLWRGYLWSLAHKKGLAAPTRYATRVIRPNGEPIYVVKDTTQLNASCGLIWVTELQVVREPELPPVPTPESLRLTESEVRSYCGQINVAQMERLAQTHEAANVGVLTNPNVDSTNPNVDSMKSNVDSMKSNVKKSRENYLIEGRAIDKEVEILEQLQQLQDEGTVTIWVRTDGTPRQVSIMQVIDLWHEASAEGMRLCLRCLSKSRIYAANSQMCPKCWQPWAKPYRRRPSGKRKP